MYDQAKLLQEKGTVFKIVTNKTNQLNDQFTIRIPGITHTNF